METASLPSVCAKLCWDSQFFGFCIARVLPSHLAPETFAAVDEFATRERVACLYFLGSSDDMASSSLAEDHGFRLMDIRVTLDRARDPADLADASRAAGVRQVTNDDLPALRRLAEVSHTGTRFFADTRLAARAPALYARWIERAVETVELGTGAVFVAEGGGEPLGYFACTAEAGTSGETAGNVGLVAVSQHAQSRGIGRALLTTGLGWLAEKGAQRTTVVTQGRNLGAQALYHRAGFVTRKVELWFHKWC